MIRVFVVTLLSVSMGTPALARDCKIEDLVPPSKWTTGEAPSTRHLQTSLDMDGDGVDDKLVAWTDHGSGFASRNAKVTLGKTGEVVELDVELAFAVMADKTKVPAGLRGDSRRKLRESMALIVFGRVCREPDPPLKRLLSPSTKLEWLAGEPKKPESYTVLIGDTWYTVGGHVHGELRSVDKNTTHELLITKHGAVVRDLKTKTFAWVWVFPGHGYHKLRWKSVSSGKLAGNTVDLDVERRNADTGNWDPGTVVVDLASGHIAETYRPIPEEERD